MIDFDPERQIAIMPQDLAMKFMVWAGFYNSLELSPCKSFSRFSRNGKALFSKADSDRLDRLQKVLFDCFEPASISSAMESLKKAKDSGEPCPFPEESLNELFGKISLI